MPGAVRWAGVGPCPEQLDGRGQVRAQWLTVKAVNRSAAVKTFILYLLPLTTTISAHITSQLRLM